MRIAVLLDECRGSMNKSEFARCLGISRRMLTALYAGERQAGRKVLSRLVRTFPDKSEGVIFLLLTRHDSAELGAIAPDHMEPPA